MLSDRRYPMLFQQVIFQLGPHLAQNHQIAVSNAAKLLSPKVYMGDFDFYAIQAIYCNRNRKVASLVLLN